MRDGILANSGRGYGTPVLADLDGDGKAEILCASRGGTLQAFTGEGKPFRDGLFQSVARAEEGAEIVVVDLGDDGAMDLFIGARWLRFTPTGIEAWNLLPGEKNVRVSGTPSVVDLDGGGLAEVVIGARDGRVWIYDTGKTIDTKGLQWHTNSGSFRHTSAWFNPLTRTKNQEKWSLSRWKP